MDVAEPLLLIPYLSGTLLIALPELVLGVGGIVILLFLSGLVSGSEVAFFSLTAGDYESLEQENSAISRRLLDMRDRPRTLLASILIANNFVNIAIVLLSDFLLKRIFPETLFLSWAEWLQQQIPYLASWWTTASIGGGISFLITVIGVTFLLVLFGEVAPKVYARFNRLVLARRMSGPLQAFMGFSYPLSFLLVKGTSIIERRLEHRSQDVASASREEIDSAIELTVSSADEGEHSQQDIDILKRIVKFSDVTVRQIMRARMDVTAVDQKISYHELLEVVRGSGYSRIPVYDEDFDKVKGILYVKDLLGHLGYPEDFAWNELVRKEVLFIPESKKISDLLREFQREKMHMAIVIDEYGGSEGVVTLEDIMEEVIGDIHDEFDDDQEIIFHKVDDLNYIFDGKTLLNDVCRIIDVPTDTFDGVKGEYESFAGLILQLQGGFPAPEQEMSLAPFRFKVVSVNERRIEEILITLPENEETK